MRTWRLLVGIGVGVLSIGTTGCYSASYTWGEPKVVSSQTLSVETRPEFASGLTFDKATIDGTTLRVQATRACTTMRDAVTEDVSEQKELVDWPMNATTSLRGDFNVGRREVGNLAPSLVTLGTMLVGLPISTYKFWNGLNGLTKEGNCFPNSYPPCGADARTETLGGAAGLTAILVGIPILWNAVFGKEPPRRVARWSTTSAAAGACTSKVAEGSLLFAALGEHIVELGKTDAQGKLEVKLDQFVGAKALLAGGARWTLKLAVGGATEKPIEVKTDVFFAAMDDAVWKATDEQTCAKQKTREACTSVARYASLYPAGKHAREAASLGVAVVPALEGSKP